MGDTPACNLGEVALRTRVERWRQLIERSALDRAIGGDGMRIRFREDPATSRELSALVAAERECCDAIDWRVQASPGELVLHVVTTADSIGAPRQLIGTFHSGASRTSEPEGNRR